MYHAKQPDVKDRVFALTILMLVYAAGCATAPKRYAPFKLATAEDCGDFDDLIRSCVKAVNHSKLFSTLKKISHCETGNKCTGKIDSPNGLYHGAFQYSTLTWNSQCAPIFTKQNLSQCQKTNAVYDTCCAAMCAAEMISNGGISNWPTCGQ